MPCSPEGGLWHEHGIQLVRKLSNDIRQSQFPCDLQARCPWLWMRWSWVRPKSTHQNYRLLGLMGKRRFEPSFDVRLGDSPRPKAAPLGGRCYARMTVRSKAPSHPGRTSRSTEASSFLGRLLLLLLSLIQLSQLFINSKHPSAQLRLKLNWSAHSLWTLALSWQCPICSRIGSTVGKL